MTDDVTRCPDPDALLVLLYDDEGEPDERATLEWHVDRCPQCADVLASLETARGVLGAWHAPRLPLGFALVRQDRAPLRSTLWRGGLAAAAVLVLAAAASLARIDISYDDNGFRIRTGVPRGAVSASVTDDSRAREMSQALTPAALSVEATPAAQPAPVASWVGKAGAGDPPWRQDMDLLATQIRADVSRLLQEAPLRQAPAARAASAEPVGPVRTMTDAELLAKVQDLLDKSEVRQQANLALRVTELGRQFELQRQGDIVQVEQAFQRLEQQRNDLLRRVAAQQPRP